MEQWVSDTFNGATPGQITIAFVIFFGMIWVYWKGLHNTKNPPPPREHATDDL